MKRDIFHGKIKKEYFSYILVYMIFFLLLLVGVCVLCVCAAIWGMKSNSMGERLLIAVFGAVALVLAAVYLFLELLVIRRFPNTKGSDARCSIPTVTSPKAILTSITEETDGGIRPLLSWSGSLRRQKRGWAASDPLGIRSTSPL